jgi:hypothetical protein
MRGDRNRAITSAPPPAPAGTTNSTGLLGSQAAEAIPLNRKQTVKVNAEMSNVFIIFLFMLGTPFE